MKAGRELELFTDKMVDEIVGFIKDDRKMFNVLSAAIQELSDISVARTMHKIFWDSYQRHGCGD